ncbi:MAG: PIG-L family deacetylase [Candidatus Altiarchaeota archaeon]
MKDRILVLSPHPDDDVIGCGGTIYKHSAENDHVKVVYLTDGRECNPSLTDEEKGIIALKRKSEAKKATNILKVDDLVFLDFPDTKLGFYTGEAASRLKSIIEDYQPDIIYLPWLGDDHVDHKATNSILARTLERSNQDYVIRGYEIWTSLTPNKSVDITEIIDLKKKALDQFETQNRILNLKKMTISRNKSRGAGSKNYAEAFISKNSKEYLDGVRVGI